MSIPQPHVAQYELNVDTRETLATVRAHTQNTDAAREFASMLRHAATRAVTASSPAASEPVDLPAHAGDAVTALATAGLINARVAWRETSTEAYLSESRILTVVQLPHPITAHCADPSQRTPRHITRTASRPAGTSSPK